MSCHTRRVASKATAFRHKESAPACRQLLFNRRLGGCLVPAGVKHIETSVYAFTIVTSIGYGNFAPTTGACSRSY